MPKIFMNFPPILGIPKDPQIYTKKNILFNK